MAGPKAAASATPKEDTKEVTETPKEDTTVEKKVEEEATKETEKKEEETKNGDGEKKEEEPTKESEKKDEEATKETEKKEEEATKETEKKEEEVAKETDKKEEEDTSKETDKKEEVTKDGEGEKKEEPTKETVKKEEEIKAEAVDGETKDVDDKKDAVDDKKDDTVAKATTKEEAVVVGEGDKPAVATTDSPGKISRKTEVLKRPQDASTVVTRNGKTWNEMFLSLVSYKAEHGDTMVPDRWKTPDDVCLGLWVRNQRRRRDSLTEEQRTRLSELGLDWQTQNERFDNVWHDRYAKLTEYRVEHGDCRVPYTYKPDPALAKWVSQQRAQQAQGRLAIDRKTKLDAIDFSWKLNTVKNRNTKTEDKKWQRQYENLVAFKEVHSHCRVPDRYKADKPLGTWVKKQRLANATDQLKLDRKKMLDELGFVWRITDKTDGEKWSNMFEKLKDYKESNGSCHVSRTVPDSELKPLARWVKTQRALYKSGKILADRKTRLETINFVWDGTQLPIKRKRRRQSEDGETKAKAEPKAKKAKTPAADKKGDGEKPAAATEEGSDKTTATKKAAEKANGKKAAATKPKEEEMPALAEAKVVDKEVIESTEKAPAAKAATKDTATKDQEKDKAATTDKKAKATEKESPAKATKSEESTTPNRRGKRTKIPMNTPKEEEEEEEKNEEGGKRGARTKTKATFYV